MAKTEFFGGPKDGDRVTLRGQSSPLRYYQSASPVYAHAYELTSGRMEYRDLVYRDSVQGVQPLTVGEER